MCCCRLKSGTISKVEVTSDPLVLQAADSHRANSRCQIALLSCACLPPISRILVREIRSVLILGKLFVQQSITSVVYSTKDW